MSTLLKKAINGNMKAMLALYTENKQQVYDCALELLGNATDAEKAVVYVFKNIWNDIAKKNVQSEDAFAELALERAARYCKRLSKSAKNEDNQEIDMDAEVNAFISAISGNRQQKLKKNIVSAIVGGGAALVLSVAVIIAVLFGNGAFAGDPNEITHYADIVIEDYGTITVALYGNAAPKTVKNFVKLANKGFYDGLTFHRIMEGFMMQGGCPEGTGGGSSGKNIKGEFSKNGVNNKLRHTRGAISMARGEEYNSASCQFFIVHEDSTFLDGAYAAFGYVTEGIEVVDAVCADANPVNNNGKILADEQPVIKSITIREP